MFIWTISLFVFFFLFFLIFSRDHIIPQLISVFKWSWPVSGHRCVCHLSGFVGSNCRCVMSLPAAALCAAPGASIQKKNLASKLILIDTTTSAHAQEGFDRKECWRCRPAVLGEKGVISCCVYSFSLAANEKIGNKRFGANARGGCMHACRRTAWPPSCCSAGTRNTTWHHAWGAVLPAAAASNLTQYYITSTKLKQICAVDKPLLPDFFFFLYFFGDVVIFFCL